MLDLVNTRSWSVVAVATIRKGIADVGGRIKNKKKDERIAASGCGRGRGYRIKYRNEFTDTSGAAESRSHSPSNYNGYVCFVARVFHASLGYSASIFNGGRRRPESRIYFFPPCLFCAIICPNRKCLYIMDWARDNLTVYVHRFAFSIMNESLSLFFYRRR